MAMDPYKVLGVSRNADDAAIKKAYIELTKKYHPDQYVNHPLANLAEEKMKEINEAYDILSNKKQGQRSSSSSSYGSYGGGYNQSNQNYDYGDSYGSDSTADEEEIFRQVQECINRGDLNGADRLLSQISRQGAHWCYLKGVIAAKRGWYDQASRLWQRAMQLDPDNEVYRNAYNSLLRNANNYRYNSAQMGYGNNGVDGLCQCCTTMLCMDCLCSSCGSGCC